MDSGKLLNYRAVEEGDDDEAGVLPPTPNNIVDELGDDLVDESGNSIVWM